MTIKPHYLSVWLNLILLVLLSMSQVCCTHSAKTDFIGKWQTDYGAQNSVWVYGMEISPDGTCHLCTYQPSDPLKRGEVSNGDLEWEERKGTFILGAPGNPSPAIGRLVRGNLVVSIDGPPLVFHRVSDFDWRRF